MKKAIFILPLVFLVVAIQTITAQDTLTLLRGAIKQRNPDEVRRLIEAGADVNEKFNIGASRGLTPLFQACIFSFLFSRDDSDKVDNVEIIKLLIDAGANVNEKYEGMTVLSQAIKWGGDTAIIKPLVAGGLDIDAKNISGKTVLHGAAILGKTEWVEPLIENGADLNAKDDYGNTPLHLAVENFHKAPQSEKKFYKEVVEILITKGADINAKAKNGETPLDKTIFWDNKELADLLRKHGGISGNK